MRVLWSANISGSGPPLVVAGLVWTVGKNGVLYGLDAATGQVRRQVTIGAVRQRLHDPERGRRVHVGRVDEPGSGFSRDTVSTSLPELSTVLCRGGCRVVARPVNPVDARPNG